MTRGEKVIAFIETYCKVPEGKDVGKPVVLAEFQKKFILDIYDNPHGTRRAILGIARKNGKSALIAGIMLASIIGPEAQLNSQVVSGSNSRDQAALVFNLACKMIQLNPALQDKARIIPSGKKIIGLSKNVEYKALAADGTTAHGLSPVLAIIDECGQVKGPTTPFLEAILTSQGAHENPLQIFISTSSASEADFFSAMINDAIVSDDKRVVCHVYKADEGCDLMDREQWVKANPALGLFRSESDLEEQLKQASRLPAMEASARNLLLNQIISLDTIWLAPTIWRENGGQPDLDVFRRNGAYVGLDLSQKNDLTAAVLASQDEDGVVHLLPLAFTPLVGLEDRARRDRNPYDAWVRKGQMVAVDGATIDYDWVSQYLAQFCNERQIEVNAILFDRWRAPEFFAACDRQGFAPYAEKVAIGQGYQSMTPIIEAFETALLQKKIRHGLHPVLNMGASSAIRVQDAAGGSKLDKTRASNKIDGLVAAVMAAHGILAKTEQEFDIAALVG